MSSVAFRYATKLESESVLYKNLVLEARREIIGFLIQTHFRIVEEHALKGTYYITIGMRSVFESLQNELNIYLDMLSENTRIIDIKWIGLRDYYDSCVLWETPSLLSI